MLILAARFVFVISFFVGSNNGEQLLMRAMDDQHIYKLSGCIAHCVYMESLRQQQNEQQEQQQQQQQSRKEAFQSGPQHGNHSKHWREQQQQRYHDTRFLSCFDSCQSGNLNTSSMPLEKLRKVQENFNLKLVCRDDKSLTFRIDMEEAAEEPMTPRIKHQKKHNETVPHALQTRKVLRMKREMTSAINTIYAIKVHGSNDVKVYLSNDNFLTISNLTHKTTYHITAVAIHASQEYSIIAKEQAYTTLQRGFKPGNVTDIVIKGFDDDESNEMRLVAKITWKASADMTCHYDIICYSPKNQDYDMTPHEIRNPRELYSYTLENLSFSSEYKVGIRAKNPNDASRESGLFWKNFEAPSCVEWFEYNFNICTPFEPEGLQVLPEPIQENIYSLNVTWQEPQYFPDYYTLRIMDFAEGHKTHSFNVSKELSNVFIPEIPLMGPVFAVHLTAYTPGGKATALWGDYNNVKVMIPDKGHQHHQIVKLISVILAPIFCIIILSLTTFIICHRRAKLKRYQERCKYFEELEKKAPIDPKATFDFPTKSLPLLTSPEDLTQFQLDLEEKIFFNDAMEIDRNDIRLHEVLGEGAFGLVRRGTYNDDKLGPREVAVKMLKDHPSIDDVRAFRREIEVMKSVEKHPNIVGIIGHCTKRLNEMMLLTEYCSFGNLLDFLRDEWKYLYELNLKCNSRTTPPNISSSHRELMKNLKGVSLPQENGSGGAIFDTESSIIEKLSIKYNNLSVTNRKYSQTSGVQDVRDVIIDNKNVDLTFNTTFKDVIQTSPSSTTMPATAADNKSYGYDEICIKSCKCQRKKGDNNATMESHIDCNSLQQKEDQKKRISCDCQHWLLAKNNARNANDAFAPNYLPDLAAEVKQRQRQWQRKNARLAHSSNKYDNNDNNNKNDKDNAEGGNLLSGSIKREPLSAADLLDIAKQVALGMEYLAKNKVVHRDLAARNVLVAPDRTVKIADFGLSRDIYQENIYKKTGNGKLPIKWLALESMTHQVYTTQSDVWSYGILLYEIVTLGGTPYPSIPTNRLLHLLKSGYRMEKPKNCGPEFYNLMFSCWHLNPAERPTFGEVIKILDNLMTDSPEQQIENVMAVVATTTLGNSIEKYPVEEPLNNDDSYLKPL